MDIRLAINLGIYIIYRIPDMICRKYRISGLIIDMKNPPRSTEWALNSGRSCHTLNEADIYGKYYIINPILNTLLYIYTYIYIFEYHPWVNVLRRCGKPLQGKPLGNPWKWSTWKMVDFPHRSVSVRSLR